MGQGAAAVAAGVMVAASVALAQPAKAADDANSCRLETARQERRAAVPEHLLHAISLVESGRWDAARRTSTAWPWTVTAEGDGRFLPDKPAAVALIRRLRAAGVGNIDVGCMQVNLQAHPSAFRSLDDALDPATNVAYAADFLVRLHDETGSWPIAAAYYHSRTPALASAYATKVAIQMNAAKRHDDATVLVADKATAPEPRVTPAVVRIASAAMPNTQMLRVRASSPPVQLIVKSNPAVAPAAAPPPVAVGATEPLPATAAAWFEKGRAAMLAHDYGAAEPAMMHAAALDRGNARYLDALGTAAAAAGHGERALAAWQMAVAIDANDGFAWYNTAVVHSGAGRTDAAIDAYRHAGIAYSAKGDTSGAGRVLASLKSLAEG